MDQDSASNISSNISPDTACNSTDIVEHSEVKEDKVSENANENSDDGCVDSEEEGEEMKSEVGEVDVNDDRSQTPLQDEVESYQSEKLENQPLEFNAGQLDRTETPPNDVKEDSFINDLNGIQEEEEKEEAKCEPSNLTEDFKGNELNDDHGELDYEEDVDDNKISNKNNDNFSDDNSESGEVDSNTNRTGKEPDGDKESHSSDGELLDDDDCEEGEIKEPGQRRQFQRPLCRFFTRGSCTWGGNCRFLHPGVNDKGNYSMLHQPSYFNTPTMPPPIRAPHYSTVHERLGNRFPPPVIIPQVEGKGGETVGGGGGKQESAWERGLRHAKEIRNKLKTGEADDKKDTSPVSSPSPSPTNHTRAPHLAPPPPRDPFFDELHRPIPPIMSNLPPMHPMHLGPPMQPHPMEGWPYRPPHHMEFDMMRWPRPPHMHHPQQHDFLHQALPHQYDYRMQGRDRRFSPSQRGTGRFERFGRPGDSNATTTANASSFNRSKPEEWKDPWSRTKPLKGKPASSSRSRSRKRSRTSYSSFTSSSYSSHSRSRSASSYSSSRSSSRSSSSRSVSRSISAAPRNRKKAPQSNKTSEAAKTKINPKVIPPSLADLNSSPLQKLPPTKQKVPVNIPPATIKPPPPKPLPPKPIIVPTPLPAPEPVVKEVVVPVKPPMMISLPSKPGKSLSKTNQLQPVGKSVAEAFKDADDEEERARKKPRLSKFSSEESLAMLDSKTKDGISMMAGGMAYKSGIVQGNIGYPVPVKPSQDASKSSISGLKRKKLPDKFSRSKESSESRSSYTSTSSGSSSGSSSSSQSRHSKRYSNLASPISSDSSASPSKQKSKLDRLRLAKPPQEFPAYRHPNPTGPVHNRNGMRGGHYRGARAAEFLPERREYRQENRPYPLEEPPQRPPPRRQEFNRHPPEFRGNPAYLGDVGGRERIEEGHKGPDMPRNDRPDLTRDSREYRGKEDEPRGDFHSRYGDERRMKEPRGAREAMFGAGKRGRGGPRHQERRPDDEYDTRPRRDSPPPEARRPPHGPPPTNKSFDSRYNQSNNFPRRPSKDQMSGQSFRKRLMSPNGGMESPPSKTIDESGRPGRPQLAAHKGGTRMDRREELLMQLKAVEDAIAKKKNKNV